MSTAIMSTAYKRLKGNKHFLSVQRNPGKANFRGLVDFMLYCERCLIANIQIKKKSLAEFLYWQMPYCGVTLYQIRGLILEKQNCKKIKICPTFTESVVYQPAAQKAQVTDGPDGPTNERIDHRTRCLSGATCKGAEKKDVAIAQAGSAVLSSLFSIHIPLHSILDGVGPISPADISKKHCRILHKTF